MIRLLIVDDEPGYREYLKRYLSREGYEIQTASSGREAIEISAKFKPEILLADWMLKDYMHGLDVGMALREQNPKLQILLMTGFPSAEIREAADHADVFRFLEKPFGLDEVAEAIAQAAQRAESFRERSTVS